MSQRTSQLCLIENEGFAGALLTRIAVREKARAQAEFLRLLDATPMSEKLIFRGSTALHGIHLSPSHQRFGGDLDFIAEKDVVRAFRADPASFGLPLEHHERPDGSRGIVYPYCGVVLRRLLLPIDVCHPHPKGLTHEPGIFQSAEGKQTVTVRKVMPFIQAVAEKVDAVTKRQKATDFLDLWFALGDRETDMVAVRRAFNCRSGPIPLRTATALDKLDSMETTWAADLTPTLLVPVPPFERVRADLAAWFHEFESTAAGPYS